MSNTPLLLDKLVQLTAIRDIELLEFSLLKTLNEILHPSQLSLFKLDKHDRARYVMRYGREGNCEIDEVNLGEFELPSEILDAARQAQRMHSPYRGHQADGQSLFIHHILGLKTFDTYLMVRTNRAPNRVEECLCEGLLQIYQNFCSLLYESQRDQLTGLPNRKTFDESIQKIFALSQNENCTYHNYDRRKFSTADQPPSFWLGMIDIDHFKKINDNFGHLYGDEVLLLISQIMQHCFRDEDLLFRFGGEEFVAITSGTDRKGSWSAFERFRDAVANHPFPQVGQVTVSMGSVQITPDIIPSILLDRADQALYFAKNNGRNRVCSYEDLVEAGYIRANSIQTGSIDLF